MDFDGAGAAIRNWTIAQLTTGTTEIDQWICDSKSLRGSIEPTTGGGYAFIAQVTLYSAALGVANTQGCYANRENDEHAVHQKLLGEMDLAGVLIKVDALHTQHGFFGSSRRRGPTSC